ncbi:hypothetical protein SAMN05446037_1009120 [Anaerovirgula multivorans]|uniref:Uncharacterized protein n=1 Tax=Anaerovirgula multivorans TaxID=312168 RepID=A0A239E866_9FIRM|nr:hypothetical protein [Anaerovirgula multivorans]SNS40836.1 hypothetical protein SAMN05446037_1009120 [Anaerovirgula multivorans]
MISIKNKTTILVISLVINLILLVFLAGFNVEVADHNNRESIRTLKSKVLVLTGSTSEYKPIQKA